MDIRRATIDDVSGLMRLYHVLSTRYQDDVSAVRLAIRHPTTFVYVAVDGERVAGTATLSLRAVPSRGLVGYIDDVVVDPTCRGQNLGQRLTQYCLNQAMTAECVRVELTSAPERQAANHLYQKMGFSLKQTNCYVMDL